MIKQALAQGDVPYLTKLFDTYLILRDERELIKVGVKLIQKADKLPKDKLIEVFDRIYDIVGKQRKVFREIIEIEKVEQKNINKRKVKYLKEYKDHLSSTITEIVKKILKEIKKGIVTVINHSKELELFLHLNLCDYNRYLCEVTNSQTMKEEFIRETEMSYQKYFAIAKDSNTHEINPSNVTAHYHYALFMYEIQHKRKEAIRYLKDLQDRNVDNLDSAYKFYIDSYPLMDLITDTLTTWIIISNANEEYEREQEKEEEKEKDKGNVSLNIHT